MTWSFLLGFGDGSFISLGLSTATPTADDAATPAIERQHEKPDAASELQEMTDG